MVNITAVYTTTLHWYHNSIRNHQVHSTSRFEFARSKQSAVSWFMWLQNHAAITIAMHSCRCISTYRLDTDSKGSTRFRTPRALGCIYKHPERSEGVTNDPRVSKSHRSHWSQCLNDLEHRSLSKYAYPPPPPLKLLQRVIYYSKYATLLAPA